LKLVLKLCGLMDEWKGLIVGKCPCLNGQRDVKSLMILMHGVVVMIMMVMVVVVMVVMVLEMVMMMMVIMW